MQGLKAHSLAFIVINTAHLKACSISHKHIKTAIKSQCSTISVWNIWMKAVWWLFMHCISCKEEDCTQTMKYKSHRGCFLYVNKRLYWFHVNAFTWLVIRVPWPLSYSYSAEVLFFYLLVCVTDWTLGDKELSFHLCKYIDHMSWNKDTGLQQTIAVN